MLVGYPKDKQLQGFTVLKEDQSEAVLNSFTYQSDVYRPEILKTNFVTAVRSFDPNKPLDAYGRSLLRTEQDYLRNHLFGTKKKGFCGICDNEYPIGFLVTAHIKKRSKCSDEEKIDADSIVMPMCKFGCDDLYEKGYITVIDGKVVSNPIKEITDSVQLYINRIVGNSVSHWNEKSRNYFQWHSVYHNYPVMVW